MKLDLGGIQLPLDAVTQTFGVLAVRGAGKSNLAAVMAEEMFKAGLPFVVIDPVGSWWGLRSTGDGGPGLSIPIFGGKHGDVPLEEAGGQVLADLVVDDRVSCVLDISELSEPSDVARSLPSKRCSAERRSDVFEFLMLMWAETLEDDVPVDPPPLTWPPGHGVIPGRGWMHGWPHR